MQDVASAPELLCRMLGFMLDSEVAAVAAAATTMRPKGPLNQGGRVAVLGGPHARRLTGLCDRMPLSEVAAYRRGLPRIRWRASYGLPWESLSGFAEAAAAVRGAGNVSFTVFGKGGWRRLRGAGSAEERIETWAPTVTLSYRTRPGTLDISFGDLGFWDIRVGFPTCTGLVLGEGRTRVPADNPILRAAISGDLIPALVAFPAFPEAEQDEGWEPPDFGEQALGMDWGQAERWAQGAPGYTYDDTDPGLFD